MTTAKCIIYGLVDPRTLMVRYVGLSSSGLKRALSHGKTHALSKDRSYKAKWIRLLQRESLNYEIAILQESELDALEDNERWWIRYGRLSGWPLTNMTDGGDGTRGLVVSPETRARISAAQRGRKRSPEHVAKVAAAHRGRKLSDEHRAKLSESHRGQRQSAETIARRAAALTGRKRVAPPAPGIRINLRPKKLRQIVSPEARKRITDAVRAANTGRRLPAEQRMKISAANMGRLLSPEAIGRMTATKRIRAALITHCPRGHAYSADNTRYKPGRVTRICRQCDRDYADRKRAERIGQGVDS